MFHEFRELMSELKGKNARFDTLFEKHNELDHRVAEAVANFASDLEIDSLKKEKLKAKDELYNFLLDYQKNNK